MVEGESAGLAHAAVPSPGACICISRVGAMRSAQVDCTWQVSIGPCNCLCSIAGATRPARTGESCRGAPPEMPARQAAPRTGPSIGAGRMCACTTAPKPRTTQADQSADRSLSLASAAAPRPPAPEQCTPGGNSMPSCRARSGCIRSRKGSDRTGGLDQRCAIGREWSICMTSWEGSATTGFLTAQSSATAQPTHTPYTTSKGGISLPANQLTLDARDLRSIRGPARERLGPIMHDLG